MFTCMSRCRRIVFVMKSSYRPKVAEAGPNWNSCATLGYGADTSGTDAINAVAPGADPPGTDPRGADAPGVTDPQGRERSARLRPIQPCTGAQDGAHLGAVVFRVPAMAVPGMENQWGMKPKPRPPAFAGT